LFTTTVTRAELLDGVRLLPDSRRKEHLSQATLAIFTEDLVGRVLSFDSDAADAYAEIAGLRKSAGSPISQFDAMIAAITRSRGASLATRNVKDFGDCDITVINPWNSTG
jgi:predicted nucleic acid-binding protein